MPTETAPHTYKQQRRMEKEAATTRMKVLAEGGKLPPVCGYTYATRPSTHAKSLGIKSTEVQCMRTAGAETNHHGRGYCDYHDYQAKRDFNKVAPSSQLHKAKVLAQKNAHFFGEPVASDPHTVILDEIARTASIVAWLEKRMNEMRDSGIDDDSIIGQYIAKEGIQPSIWMQLFQDERQHLVSTCIAAIKAGIAERRVRIAEEQGRLIAAMLMAFMHDAELNLSQDQLLRAPGIIRRHLMAIPTGTPHEANSIIEAQAWDPTC